MSVTSEYFDWLCAAIDSPDNYRRLLTNLHRVRFTCLLSLDTNRAEDGKALRYRFGRRCNYSRDIVQSELDTRPCSVLEMMVALSIRCEEHIMENADIGDRTSYWFWSMVRNLGLDGMTDDQFDICHFKEIIDRFLSRKYKKDGTGSLFIVKNGKDIRRVEIWYQMHMYLENMF